MGHQEQQQGHTVHGGRVGYVLGLSSRVVQGRTFDARVAGQERSGIILRYWLLLVTGTTPPLRSSWTPQALPLQNMISGQILCRSDGILQSSLCGFSNEELPVCVLGKNLVGFPAAAGTCRILPW